MSTDLKFSLVTTIIVLGLIVAVVDCRAALISSRGSAFSLASPSCLLAKWQKCFLFLLFSFFCDCCHAFATLMNIA